MAGYGPDNGGALAATGFAGAAGLGDMLMGAGGLLVGGGILIAAAKVFGPRVAVEPRYDMVRGKERLQLTLNGEPVKRRRM